MDTQAPAGQDQVRLLTELEQQLLRERENNQGLGDPYITTRISLTEALPSIEEDFFKLPLSKKERKMAIHSCSKTSSMNYNPPPLNDSATSAVKKTDSALYGIQSLVQATRPIDYYVHRRIQDNPGLNTTEDSATLFASTMRALLADIAATVTQARIDSLYRGLDLPGKPTELIKTEVKPFINQEALDALLAKKPTVKRQRVQPFYRHQQYTISTDTYSSNTATTPSTSAANTEAGFNNRTSDRQANFCERGRGQGRRGPSSYVQIGLAQTNRQPMGLGHSRKWIQNPLQKPSLSRIDVFRLDNPTFGRLFDSDNIDSRAGGICCKLFGLTESAMSTISATDITPESLQEKTETRSKQDLNRRSSITPGKECNRGSSNKEARLLQFPVHYTKENWG
ncbi:hypothetical protein BB561_006524, partial [Smittium simulii]